MAISDKKLRQVYSTLQKGGYGEDYDTFMRGFAGNENYQNRKQVYDLLKGAGADIGDTYEDFIGNLQSDNKGSGNYVYNPDGISPVEEKKEEVQPVINVENTEEEGVDDTTFADYMRGIQAGMRQTQDAIDRTNKAVEYGQKNIGPNVKPVSLDIADNRNVMEEEVYNPETMQMEKQYTTSYGGTYQDKFSAKQEQDKIDLKNRFDSLQRGIEKERQSVYAEVDAEIEKLQKQIDTLNAMKKDGEPKQVEGYRQQTIADLENKIADLQEKRGEFDKEAEFRANKFLYENSGMKEQVDEAMQQANETLYEMNEDDKVRQAIDAVQRNSPNLVLRGAAAGAENLYDLVKRWSNPEYGKAVATQRKLSDAAKTTETALGKDDSTWMTHLLRGAWDGATDIRTWDFGINDMTDMGRLYQLQAKADRIARKELAGEESEEKLTASEQKMLDAIALSNTMEANFSGHVPMSYRVGKSVPESAGFAAAIAMNPASGLGKSIGKKAARRLIANGMTTMRYGKWGVKALSAGARVGGDALEALSTTLTTALPRTVEGVFEDMAGTAQGGYDERGNLVFDKVTDMERNTMKAVGKGIYTNWMENQSEMVGEYFQPIGNFIRQATKNRVWMRNAVDVILGSDDAAKKSLIGKFRDRAKINGVFGEYTEEAYNNVMNAVPWGDMNMTGGVMRPNRADYKTEKEYNQAMEEWRGSVFNAETNVETFLSVTAMIFPMGAAELGGRYLNAYTTKAQLDVAIDNLNKTIGQEQASAIMNEMRNAESLQDMSKIYLSAMQDGRIKDGKQARALLDAVGRLVAYQSVNTSQANSTITEDKFERDYRNAYDAGHEMPIENKHKAGLEYERSMQELDRVLGDSFQGIASMPFEQFQRLMQTLTPEQRSVAQEYYLQSARLAGMRDASMEEADKQVQMHYNTLRRVADKNGIVYRGSSLEEGEFISPESMRIPGSRMLVVLNADNPEASRVIAREEAGEISTSEMNEELRTMQEGLRLKAQNDYLWGVMHNPSTKMPQVGETIEYDEDGSGNGKRMRVIGFNEQGQVQLLPTYIDGETMEEKVSSGEPIVMSQYEALKRQDSYYDALEAEQSATETEGQTVITPVTEGLNDSNIETLSQTGGLDDSNIETLSQTETAPETDATILTDEQRGVIDNWMNAEDDINLVHARIDSVGDDVWSQDTKQAMHQYVDSVRSQQTPTTDSQQEQTTDGQQEQTTDSQQKQTTDSQPEQTTYSQPEQTAKLPRDEKGNVLYHKAPIETTVADLMDGSLEDDEIDAFVEANIASAQKEVDKRTKDKPVMTTNKEKYLKEKAKWKENLTEAEGILAYWNTVKDAVEEKRNAVTETETEPMTEQTESVNGQNESSNESVNESMTEQTDGENAPVQTEWETENAPVQTEGETENDPVQTEGETENAPVQTEGETETTPVQTEGETETTPVQTEGETERMTESDNGEEKKSQKGKKKKELKVRYSISDFLSKIRTDKKDRPALTGVYHDKGYAVATDGFALVADKRGYEPENEGKIIGEEGEIKGVIFPKWYSIIPQNMRECSFDPRRMLQFLEAVKKKAKEEKLKYKTLPIYFELDGKMHFCKAEYMEKFCQACLSLNAKLYMTDNGITKMIVGEGESGITLNVIHREMTMDDPRDFNAIVYEEPLTLGDEVESRTWKETSTRASLRAEEENAEDVLEMQPVIVEPIDETDAEGEITQIEDTDAEEETQDIFDQAEMLREREQAEKLLGKEIARINRMAKNARWVDSYRKDGTLSRKQIRAMENLASKLGLKIEWHDTMAENGLYDPKTRTIHIAFDAENPIDAVFGHETMHKIAENEEDYEMMRNLAIEILGEEEFTRRADGAEELYRSKDYNYDRAYYEQEVVCDFMGDMLHNNDLLERVSWNANHRVLAAIRDVLDRIISGLGLVDENLVRVRTVVSAAYNNAIRRAEEGNEDVSVEEERKASHRRKEEVDAKSRAYFESNKTGLTEKEYDEGQAMMDRMASLMNPYIDATAKGRRILPEERYGGKDAASTIFSNGSYGKSMENTLICLRTLAYNEFVNAVKRELGRPITQKESFLASQMVYDIATDPQCLYCYVSLDRKAYDEFLLRYMTQRDDVLNKFRALSEGEKNIGKKNPNEALAELYKEYLNGRKDTKEQKNRFNMWIRNEIAGIKTITTADLATSEDRENILNGLDEALAAQVKDAEKYAKSAAWAKKEVDYISYVGELLKLSKNWVNKLTSEYGLRFYSFSEYTPAFLLENMQMVRDAALRGLRGLGYTKEIDFVKVFAPTGMNINCSCYGRLDKDGNMQMDTLQGADWNEVKELRNKYKNVGAVFVATNDAAVEWALAQDWIDVVIPFHIVRTGQDIADFYGWTNYSSEQSDKAKQGQRKMYISPVEHKNDKETFLAACEKHNVTPRFAKWLDNPNYMKLVNETRLSVDESVPLKPVFDMEAAEDSWTRFVNKGGYYNGWWQVDEEGLLKAIQRVVSDIKEGKKANEVEYGNQKMPVNVDKMAKEARKKRMHGQAPIMDVFDKFGNVIPAQEIRASVRKGTNAPEMTDEEEEIITKAKENGTYMKAPNGEQSNLSPRQWVQVRTKAFKKWFGDWENDPANASKVVDENGEPLVVYHGSKNDWTEYDKDRFKKDQFGRGIYLSEDRRNAEEYGKVMELFVNSRQPFYAGFIWENGKRAIKPQVAGYLFNHDTIDKKDYIPELQKLINEEDAKVLGAELSSADSVVISYKNPYVKYGEIVVSDPTQIKSATDNIGTFDGNNPDIRYSLRKDTNVPEMTDEERALSYEGDSDIRFSLRTEPAPKKTKTAYAVFIAKKHKDGSVSLHPKMIAGEEVGAPPLTWLNADTGKINRDKNGNPIQNTVGRVKVLDSKNQPLAWRPGKHLAPYPNASQFAVSTKDSPTYKDKNGDERSVRDHLPDDVIFFEVEYAADKDYQLEAWEYGVNKKGKYQHSQAGLPYIPKDGYYVYRTNANPDIPAMIITGAYRIKRALNDDEAKRLNIEAGGEWFDRVSGKPITDERLKELGLDEEGLKKKAQTFDYNKLDPAHDESSDAMSMPGYVRRDLNFADENLLKAIEENQRAIPDFPGVEYYEKKYAEEKGSEATDDIFSRAKQIRDNQQARASLRNNSRGVGLTYTAMQRAWDREMSKASYFAKEGYWDYLASVDEFQKLIARETGREISSIEDTYRAMLSLSSKNANDMKQFDSLLALPLQKAILKLIGATKNYDRGPGRELCDYLMAKHGIERNRDMAVRNALKEKNTDENGLDRASYGNDLDMYYASVDKVLVDAEQNGYSWRLTEELLDQTAESYGADLNIDYSGLQGMYTDEGADEYVDYQTSKQSAIRDVEYYEAMKDKEDLEELWDAVRAISSYSLVKQSQSGLTNEDYLRDQMRRYRYFVPLRGFAEDTAEEMYDYIDADRTNGGLGSPVKTAKGHQHKSGDPIGNLLNVAYRSIASGNKNMAISHLYNLATTRDTGGILKVNKIWLENKGTKDDPDWVMVTPNLTDPSTGGPEMSGEDVQAELDRFEKEMQQKKEQGLVMQVTDTSVTPPYRIEQKQHNKSHQIRVNVAGRPRVITVVGNPRLAMAMNGLLNPQTSAWKGLSVLNNFLSAAFTSVNPSFGAANLVRDSLHSNMRMFVSESPIYWAKYTAKQKMLVGNAANWAQMLIMLRDYQKGRRPSGQRAQMFWEFMDGGGATGYTMIRNQEESIQFVKDMMRELKKGKTSKVNPMRLFDLFSYANEAAELVNRFLAYETSREMGRTIERSINDAKEATLNFNRKGSGTKSLTDKRGIAYTLANALNYYSQYGRSFLIFFNAFAQGQRQLWEMAKANPGKFTLAFGVVPAVTAGIALPMLNNVLLPAIYSMASGAGDDDDYVDYYDDLSDWERHHNLCIRAGKSWIKIPLSPELSSMYALGDVIGGAVWGKREMSASDLMVLADLLVPNNVDTSNPKVTAAAYAPSSVRPLVNVGINMDFMGRPISKEGPYNKYSPAWRKATRSTSKSLTALSRALNAASGGSDERQGVLDVNPGYVQEMMTGLAGGYMSTTLAVSDALLPVHLAGGGTEQSFASGAKALWDRGGVPIISRFYVPGSGERKTSRAKSQYYETVVPMMQKVQYEFSKIRGITREAKQDMVRADARLKDAQASGDTIAIAEALQGKERAEQALREAAQEQEIKTKELMSSGRWKAYIEMLGLTKYVDEMLKVYGQGELPDNVNDAMRSAVEIAKDLDKDD